MSVLNNPSINSLINERLWREVNNGSAWDTIQILEHQMMAEQAKKYLGSSKPQSLEFDFVRDEADDAGVTPDQWCDEVLAKAEIYSRMLRVTRRARSNIMKSGKQDDLDAVLVPYLLSMLPELISRYMNYDGRVS